MASIGFRWLDILEKEFDKAFVDLDLAIGELDSEEPSVVFTVRQKLCALSSCFAQLTHKAQTIFQNSAKIEESDINEGSLGSALEPISTDGQVAVDRGAIFMKQLQKQGSMLKELFEE